MKPLAQTFRAHGFEFQQLGRVGQVALFEKKHPLVPRPSFEVVVVQQYGDREIAGHQIEAAEALPPTSQWGKLGWTCRTREEAESKFGEVLAKTVTLADLAGLEAAED